MQNDEFYLSKCIEIAKKGKGQVSPNPLVGCVIVYKNKIIGQGYHQRYGESHAEINAINSVKNKDLLPKSTLFVNLEPCSHFGKTAPCSDLIIKYKIPKVVIGCIDTFHKVSGKGINKMRNCNIEVVVGVLKKESNYLNRRFFTFYNKKLPYVILKWAKSKDGFVAPVNQDHPFWMTSNDSKKLVHKWRSEEDSIMVGRITAYQDNPLLTVREVIGRNPTRIVIDKDLKLSQKINLYNSDAKTIILNSKKTEEIRNIFFVKIDFDNVITSTLNKLYKYNIQSLIIEGGSKTLQSFIDANMWDEARIFTANTTLSDGIRSPIIKKRIIKRKRIQDDVLTIRMND